MADTQLGDTRRPLAVITGHRAGLALSWLHVACAMAMIC